MSMPPTGAPRVPPASLRVAETALAQFGFARIPPLLPQAAPPPEFWVRESGVPRRAFPVFLEPDVAEGRAGRYLSWVASRKEAPPARAIVVVGSDSAAQDAWEHARAAPDGLVESELAILVLPKPPVAKPPHWHLGTLPHRALLRLATGIVVGLYRRAQASEGAGELDVGEMLEILKSRFNVDVAGSLGVRSDEDALFVLYQLALRDAYAPGDGAANLHLLVLKPTGPAARVPWFAA